MDIEIYDKYIMCVYECGGLTAAAKQLGISQPALSMSLSNLEKKLGYEIFNRKSKPISLTEEGKIYIDFLKRQNLLRKDCQKAIDDLHAKKDSTLMVGGPVIYVDSILILAIKKFRNKYNNCEITLKANHLKALMEETREGKMDCFISTSDDLPEQFEKVLLKKEKFYLCIPKTWKVNEKIKEFQIVPGQENKTGCMDYQIINGLEIISLVDGMPLQIEVNRFLEKHRLNLKSVLKVNQVASGVKLAAEGLGMMIATDEALDGGAYDDSLCIYELPKEVSGREIYVAYDSKRYQSDVCKDFIQFIQEMKI